MGDYTYLVTFWYITAYICKTFRVTFVPGWPVRPRLPLGPVSPLSPFKPEIPGKPGSPLGPTSPASPGLPDGPGKPLSPLGPTSPGKPLVPFLPSRPVGPGKKIFSFCSQLFQMHTSDLSPLEVWEDTKSNNGTLVFFLVHHFLLWTMSSRLEWAPWFQLCGVNFS